MSIYSGPVKQEVRAKVIKTRKRTPAKIAVFLPAAECLCIKEALKQGTIDLNTTILAIEKDAKTYWKIDEQLTNLGFTNYEIYHGKLENAGWWLEHRGKGKIDYAFFDCCGECRAAILEALTQRKKSLFKKGAYVAFTFTAATRHPDTTSFLSWTCDEIKDFEEEHYSLKGFGMLPCPTFLKRNEAAKASNTILWHLFNQYSNSKLTFFQEYRRNPTGKCVSMFSAQYLLK